jgi:hypothetical protein
LLARLEREALRAQRAFSQQRRRLRGVLDDYHRAERQHREAVRALEAARTTRKGGSS